MFLYMYVGSSYECVTIKITEINIIPCNDRSSRGSVLLESVFSVREPAGIVVSEADHTETAERRGLWQGYLL